MDAFFMTCGVIRDEFRPVISGRGVLVLGAGSWLEMFALGTRMDFFVIRPARRFISDGGRKRLHIQERSHFVK